MILRKTTKCRQMIVARYEQQVVWEAIWEYKRLGHAN
jgi:hypothetical protein